MAAPSSALTGSRRPDDRFRQRVERAEQHRGGVDGKKRRAARGNTLRRLRLASPGMGGGQDAADPARIAPPDRPGQRAIARRSASHRRRPAAHLHHARPPSPPVPALARFAGALMPGGTLPRADTELVILRVAHNTGCEYEWGHHERIGRRAGLTAEEVGGSAAAPTQVAGRRARRCSCERPTSCTPSGEIGDELWAQLRRVSDEAADRALHAGRPLRDAGDDAEHAAGPARGASRRLG